MSLTTLPAWTRTATHESYGGHVNKTDYLGQGPIDALTDMAASDVCRMAADLAACVRTAPFCVITYTCNDSSPAAPTVHSVYMMTGISESDYAGDSPPTGFPSLARNGNGDVTISFDSSYEDDYGTSGDFVAKNAVGTIHGTDAASVGFSFSSNDLRVRVNDYNNTDLADVKVTVEVS